MSRCSASFWRKRKRSSAITNPSATWDRFARQVSACRRAPKTYDQQPESLRSVQQRQQQNRRGFHPGKEVGRLSLGIGHKGRRGPGKGVFQEHCFGRRRDPWIGRNGFETVSRCRVHRTGACVVHEEQRACAVADRERPLVEVRKELGETRGLLHQADERLCGGSGRLRTLWRTMDTASTCPTVGRILTHRFGARTSKGVRQQTNCTSLTPGPCRTNTRKHL